jgi:hypothetical protein
MKRGPIRSDPLVVSRIQPSSVMSGLYKLALRSDSLYAKPFQDWVTPDVLPAIRKDGAYVMGEEKVVTGELDEDAFVLKAIGILQAKVEPLSQEREWAGKLPPDPPVRYGTLSVVQRLALPAPPRRAPWCARFSGRNLE